MSQETENRGDDTEIVRSLLDDLLDESRHYKDSKDYRELLDFVVRLRGFAPFNAMLLQMQKPGLGYAASARDWHERFGRRPKPRARPLIILWPFGPVALVYDVVDTIGDELPEDVECFVTKGQLDALQIERLSLLLSQEAIYVQLFDAGDRTAGSISVDSRSDDDGMISSYRLDLNRNHSPAVQFSTIAHELGHLCLGHLGRDANLRVPERSGLDHAQRELEAESVAYIVCRRNGTEPKSQTYLSDFINGQTTADGIGVYQIMRAAGRVETLLGLTPSSMFSGR